MRRGRVAPSAGVASRVALPRRPARSCSSSISAGALLGLTGWALSFWLGECWQPACAMLVRFAGALPSDARGASRHARAQPADPSCRWQHTPSARARAPVARLSGRRQSALWTRPRLRQPMADPASLQPGTMLTARSPSAASGRCDSTGRSERRRRRLGCSGGVASRGDGAVARARRSSPRVGTAGRDAARRAVGAPSAARRRRGRRGRQREGGRGPCGTARMGAARGPGAAPRRAAPRRGTRKLPRSVCARRVAPADGCCGAPACVRGAHVVRRCVPGL